VPIGQMAAELFRVDFDRAQAAQHAETQEAPEGATGQRVG
jgi:hypothetical protein